MNYPCGSVPKTALMEQGHKCPDVGIGRHPCLRNKGEITVAWEFESPSGYKLDAYI